VNKILWQYCFIILITYLVANLSTCGEAWEKPEVEKNGFMEFHNDPFRLVKQPTNYKMEYCSRIINYGGDPMQMMHHTEIREGDWIIRWFGEHGAYAIYNKNGKSFASQNHYGGESFPVLTEEFRYYVNKSEFKKSDTVFLGRKAIKYKKDSLNIENDNVSEVYIIDKEYNIVLANYIFLNGIKKSIVFEVTLFIKGGQTIPDSYKILP